MTNLYEMLTNVQGGDAMAVFSSECEPTPDRIAVRVLSVIRRSKTVRTVIGIHLLAAGAGGLHRRSSREPKPNTAATLHARFGSSLGEMGKG
jgi:hypothetical protein